MEPAALLSASTPRHWQSTLATCAPVPHLFLRRCRGPSARERCVQVHTKRRAKQLGVSEEELKLPQIVGLAACSARESDWANILTAHAGEHMGYTWQSSRYRCEFTSATVNRGLPWNRTALMCGGMRRMG